MRRLAAALIVPLIAACSMGPAYKRPEVKAPAQFRGQSAPLDAKSLADLAWWDLYRDPVLDKLIRTALAQNYDVRIAATNALGSLGGVARKAVPNVEGVLRQGPYEAPINASTEQLNNQMKDGDYRKALRAALARIKG